MELTFKKWKIMKDISLTYDKRKEMCIKEFALSIGISPYHSSFIEVLRYLVNNEAITLIKTWSSARIVKVNVAKLDQLIENNDVWSQFSEYVHQKKLFYNGI